MSSVRNLPEEFLLALQHGSRLRRVPLLIIGSGVSSTVPMLLSHSKKHPPIIKILADALTLHNKQGRLQELIDRADRLLEGAAHGSAKRDAVNELFSTAFHLDFARVAWRKFSADVVPRILRAEPTAAHNAIAKLLARGQAYCVSLNFDRLTWRKLREFGPATVLHDEAEIDRYFSSVDDSFLPFVIKVRGDAMSLVCERAGCSASARPVKLSMLELGVAGPISLNSGSLLCPECGGPLIAEMSFPGETQKEILGASTLRALKSYIQGRLSSVIIIGASCEWDEHVLNWAFSIARRDSLPIFHNRRKKSSDEAQSPGFVKSFGDEWFPNVPVVEILEDKDLFCDKLGALVGDRPRRVARQQSGGNREMVTPKELVDADFWSLPACRETTFEEVIFPSDGKAYLASLSQLALIDKFLGTKIHSRWEHAVGALNVASEWLSHLSMQMKQGAMHEGAETVWLLKWLGNEALLLHDYGHLPFGRVAQEVFSRINWGPGSVGDLEKMILQDRLETEGYFKVLLEALEYYTQRNRKEALSLLIEVASGRSSRPWLNAVINGPVSADRIDYVHRDKYSLSQEGSLFQLRVGGRLGWSLEASRSWLNDFLEQQTVTPNGLLALSGRSAMAAVDLWEQRVSMYRRLYHAPELRVLSRVLQEFVEAYVISYVTAGPGTENEDLMATRSLERSNEKGDLPWDLRREKGRMARRELERMLRESPTGEWGALLALAKETCTKGAFSREYQGFLRRLLAIVERVYGKAREAQEQGDGYWPEEVLAHVVYEPFLVRELNLDRVVDILRPVQHQFYFEVLFDVVDSPEVLVGPAVFRPAGGERVFGNMIVPRGTVEKWTRASVAAEVLTDAAVAGMQARVCQVIILGANEYVSPAAQRAYDLARKGLAAEGGVIEPWG